MEPTMPDGMAQVFARALGAGAVEAGFTVRERQSGRHPEHSPRISRTEAAAR